MRIITITKHKNLREKLQFEKKIRTPKEQIPLCNKFVQSQFLSKPKISNTLSHQAIKKKKNTLTQAFPVQLFYS